MRRRVHRDAGRSDIDGNCPDDRVRSGQPPTRCRPCGSRHRPGVCPRRRLRHARPQALPRSNIGCDAKDPNQDDGLSGRDDDGASPVTVEAGRRVHHAPGAPSAREPGPATGVPGGAGGLPAVPWPNSDRRSALWRRRSHARQDRRQGSKSGCDRGHPTCHNGNAPCPAGVGRGGGSRAVGVATP